RNSITAVLVTTTANGALALTANGSFTYTPNTNFVGTDRFTYTPVDTFGLAGSPATASITVYNAIVSQTITSTDLANGDVTITTATPAVPAPTPTDPVIASVTTTVLGTVTIANSVVDAQPAGEYRFLGQQIDITAPASIDPLPPLLIAFGIDASLIPSGHTQLTTQMFAAGILLT